MPLTRAQLLITIDALSYVIETPSLEWLESHHPSEIAAARRALEFFRLATVTTRTPRTTKESR